MITTLQTFSLYLPISLSERMAEVTAAFSVCRPNDSVYRHVSLLLLLVPLLVLCLHVWIVWRCIFWLEHKLIAVCIFWII